MLDEIIRLISSNALVSTIASAAIMGIFNWIWNFCWKYDDNNSIVNFLESSKNDTAYSFRTTEAIASHTNLTEERVVSLCAKNPRIMRNTKEK